MSFDLISFIALLTTIYSYMIIIYVLMSWVPSIQESFIGEMLGKMVEPFLTPFRRFIPPIMGMIDISPIVALFALRFASYGLSSILIRMMG
ncbi:hypothetical protein DCC85_14730 [Paenibacillus sp. CAA11]|uniref:YggT family protein n=1 Tax=Paenibacillus sp. CAA11 TaxID=1532905 RepID=UPI000D3978E6|nr:YggT family protein [Paenibacillus sp. CAA11]AWB45352.1 hypothetical protein DCC85_14730 [Paenibacillus sp. CAA11]